MSASRQEFFGVSVVEAMASGYRPVLPDRLSYPGLIPDEYHDEVLYPEGEFGPALARALQRPRAPEPLAEAMMRFDWTRMAPTTTAGWRVSENFAVPHQRKERRH